MGETAMTLAQEIAAIALRLAVIAPDDCQRLMQLSAKVRRIEFALDKIVANAMDAAELAEASTVVVAFPRRLS